MVLLNLKGPKKALVTTKTEQQRKKNKMSTSTPPPPPSFSLLPDEIFLNCLARCSQPDYRSLSLVSKTIRSLISSPELYTVRSQIGKTEPCLYICQELPSHDRWYTLDQTLLTITNGGWIKDELSLIPIRRPTSSTPPPSKSSTLSVGFEIYQMGGTINDQQPSSAVRVLDCRTHTWRDAPDMTVARIGADYAFIDGKIYVFGGTKEPMNWGEVFDLKSQTWKPLPILSDDAQVHLLRGELYPTSKHQKYAHDSKQGRWNLCLYPPQPKTGSWCLVEKVMFCVFGSKLMWYDSERGSWFDLKGLKDLYINLSYHASFQIATHDGKILVLWEEKQLLKFPMPLESPMPGKMQNHVFKYKRIWCAVIKLEKRIGFSGLETWGEILRLDPVLTLPDSYKLLSCITL